MNYNEIMKKLAALDIEDVVTLREAHKDNYTFCALCNSVIRDKNEIIKKAEMESYIDELLESKKNAPDGAATPSQGNVTQ